MKRMLFNATQAEELRVAIVDGQKLIDLDIESAAKEQRKSNIYKGVITRIEPSLEAAFIDYGAERHGFLPFKEVSRSYFQPGVEGSRATIREALREGQELIVQVDKDERGNKGAALTTFVSLAGRYLVLMPNNPRGGGVSRRVEGDERAELREIMDQLQTPQGMSLIARTAAIGRSAEELQWDLNYLIQLWKAIDGAANQQKGAFLIYQEGSLVIRAIRDYFQPDIGEVLIDTDDVYEQARQFMNHVMPGNVNRIKRYRDDVPLFSRFQIEHQIESAYSRQVNLPSGGAIVIDHTEALVAVDVNSGRATRGADIEETAYRTNLEAAEETARQLRLRDLGGLIVIDFIDMENQRNQRDVEQRLREALRFDRARVQVGKISRFGLMELSRQRLRPALAETSYIPCPRCSGTGHIRSAESAALHILRILEEEAMKENTAAVHTQVPVDVATFLLNEKRADIQAIELRQKVNVVLIPNINLETPQHSIVRLRHDDLNNEDLQIPSYKMVEAPVEEASRAERASEAKPPRQEAAIKNIGPSQPAPIVAEKTPPAAPAPVAAPVADAGFFARLFAWLRPKPAPIAAPAAAAPAPAAAGQGKPEGTREPRREGRRERGARDEQPREAREGREGREGRELRQPQARDENRKPREAREGKEAREPRRQRGEARKETAAEEKLAAVAAAPAAALPAVAPAPAAAPAIVSTAAPASTEAAGEEAQGRRRGRRGGRRDRSGERREGGAAQVAAAEAAVETGEIAATPTAVTPAVAEAVVAPTSVAAPVAEAAEVAPAVTAEAPVTAAVAETTAAVTPVEPVAELEQAVKPVAVEQVAEVKPAEVEVAAFEVQPVAGEAVAAAPSVEEATTPVVEAPVTEIQVAAAQVAEVPAAEAQPAEVPAVEAREAEVPTAEPKIAEALVAEVQFAEAQVAVSEPLVSEPAPAAEAVASVPAAAVASAVLEGGLVLVETSREKIVERPTAAPAEEARPRRRRPVAAPVADEPMVMIETRK
ncbi:Rne/Rng family ribonuclease [Rhodocyclus purpureus]|uniref:Rne/Rng family ribonuclease n=1 Tax=Rhodocyclus purpureus TaxID=1067 RepID=UPI0019145E21|nr:Rne/Rng family ribonuclease [Rhodocyclus purpureus]MBK5914781.1 ribonuclease E/G [Rhodocyclus purpureus]